MLVNCTKSTIAQVVPRRFRARLSRRAFVISRGNTFMRFEPVLGSLRVGAAANPS